MYSLNFYSEIQKNITENKMLFFYRCALFSSAFLIFTVQPLFTRLVLPILGGSTIVWSINLCFFQSCLLGGYVYAHFLMKTLGLRYAIPLHLVFLIGVGLLFLPLQIPVPPEDASQSIPWLLKALFTTIGAPFFILSATAPLLQSWFQSTSHSRARDPYFLYVASNWGSVGALFLFIVLFEPLTTLSQQRIFWSYGYWIATALIIFIGFQCSLEKDGAHDDSPSAPSAVSISWQDRFYWMVLAFVPSGLLVAVTAALGTDVSTFPLLWVFPLAIYLLTFILTFAQKPLIKESFFTYIYPIFAIFGFIFSLPLYSFRIIYFTFFIYIGILFISAMVCHGELVKRRPQGHECTEFYIYLSLGSVLGGLFATLVAPLLFSSHLELPLLILLGMLLRPVEITRRRFLTLFCSLFLVFFVMFCLASSQEEVYFFDLTLYFLSFLLFTQIFSKKQNGFIALLCMAFIVGNLGSQQKNLHRARSFFGMYSIYENFLEDGKKERVLLYGNTLHGVEIIPQTLSPSYKPVPTMYYIPQGGFADVLAKSRSRKNHLRVGVVGLGVGSLACYAKDGDSWTFFEIDPLVVTLAQKYFHYLSACGSNIPIVLGDGRLNLKRSGKLFDLIILDAFSSDAIPTHLLTQEALRTYRSVLADDGMIVFHVSNRHINLVPIVASAAQREGLQAWQKDNTRFKGEENTVTGLLPNVMVVSAQKENLGVLGETWKPITSSLTPWSDDYANIIGALWRNIDFFSF